tara:strand:+ start:748 stop:1098 length:351 start_codon:yes stop_codon:yes gene_type:complete
MAKKDTLKKISWRKAKGGRVMEHILEGWYDGQYLFQIGGRAVVTDLRPIRGDEWNPPRHYSIESRDDAKQIASDLLNDLNEEKHQANWQAREDASAASVQLIQDARTFLDSLKNKK